MVGLLTEQHLHHLHALSEQHSHNLTALTDQHCNYLDHSTKNKEAMEATLKEHNNALNADLQHSLTNVKTKMNAVTSKMEDVSITMDDLTAHQ